MWCLEQGLAPPPASKMLIELLILFSLTGCFAFAKLLSGASELSATGYDFVIVGGGTAGSVLANRLSANKTHSVLVLEAGHSDEGVPALEVPGLAASLLANESLIWDYTTVNQAGLHGRSLAYQRGRVLGGSSSINFMFFTRGSRDDYDRFADFTGDDGWSWDALFPYMLKAEDFVEPVGGFSSAGEIIPAVHGRDGPLLTTTNGFPFPFDDLVLQTTKIQSGSSNFSFNQDVNSGDPIGTSYIQSTTGGGARSSAASAYLHPALNRDNLHVLLGAQVTKLVEVGTSGTGQPPELRDVVFVIDDASVEYTVRGNKEVILAAGAVNTPQVLLLSGVGNASELASLNIPTTINLPAVGKEMQDHPLLSVQWTTDSTETLDAALRNATVLEEFLDEWETNRTGYYTDITFNFFSWLRFSEDTAALASFNDPSAGPTSGQAELVLIDNFSSFTEPSPDNGTYLSMVVNVASPASRGSVRLASSDPLDFPLIDPGYFTDDYDGNAMAATLCLAEDFLESSPWASMNLRRFGSWANATTDADLIDMARSRVTSFWHPCCTARMGKDDDDSAVVTSKLLLKGAAGVRVVDASVFPFIPAAHLQAPVYAIAERAADIILQTYAV
ncbi:unnamed protein product [Peniophora sp. CBMAI 1063]|nr:unnamed protein product [Peniophora sp. CBMAI 1063]